LCLRYILEEMDEAQILGIDKQADVLNCGICEYDFEPDDAKSCVPKLVRYNFTASPEQAVPVTAEPEKITGAR
jgi:probable phosphoglycerate mutase